MKNLAHFGKVLSRAEQVQIHGGGRGCPTGMCQFRGGSCRPCGDDTPPNQ